MRELTGRWYLKKKMFRYILMVEVNKRTECPITFDKSPKFTCWEKARESDFIDLNIQGA